jgi:quercetin dioxygenase-like cupin family protein
MATGASSPLIDLIGNAPEETRRGADGSLFLSMRELGSVPASGRLLRGLTPWLDSQHITSVFLLTERRWREPWSDSKAAQTYQELVHWRYDAEGGTYRGAAWRGVQLKWNDLAPVFEREPASLLDFAARRVGAALVSNKEPLRLGVQHVPKPWGREGWYTGIEKRGLSRVVSSTGESPLPYALGMFPWPILRQHDRIPILLKTLEPHPDEVLGDLYLEVHEEKWETYVVLEVDPQAWPEGVGFLRAGLDPASIERYRAAHGDNWRAEAARDLGQRIGVYELIRNGIDAILEEKLSQRGLDPARAIAPKLHDELLASLPAALREEERRARQDVESLLGKIPLRVGDAVALPPGVLHSLQHGVKVVEFQTANYERMIAMFTQKVLTQSHWDTAKALARMEKAAYAPPVPTPVLAEEGVLAERAVSYPQFTVDRVRLDAGRGWTQETADRYRLLFVVEGSGTLRLPDGSERSLAKEDALLVPATLGRFEIGAAENGPLTYLDSAPTAAPAPD